VIFVTLYIALARYRSKSVFERDQNWPLNEYLPLTSTGLKADHVQIHSAHAGLRANGMTVV
jgi:hypothetical protein